MKKCTFCGAESPDETLFCPECGASLEGAAVLEESVNTEDSGEANEETAQAAEGAGDESAQEAAEPGTESAEDTTLAEAADESADETAEGAEDANEAVEDAEDANEAVEDAQETNEDSEDYDDEAEEIAKPAKKTGSRWTWVTTLIVVISGVIILGLLGYIAVDTGWAQATWEKIRPKTKSSCTIEDYSVIEIPESTVSTVDDDAESYITSLLDGADLTDEWVQEYSAGDSSTDAQTVEEFQEYIHGYVYDYYVNAAVLDKLIEMTTVSTYDEEQYALIKEYSLESIESYASSYGVDADTLAQYSGYESADAYAEENSQETLKKFMIFDKIMKDKKLSCTQEDIDTALANYISDYGYSETYASTDEFKEEVGDAWLTMFEYLQVKNQIVMDAIRDNVKLVADSE